MKYTVQEYDWYSDNQIAIPQQEKKPIVVSEKGTRLITESGPVLLPKLAADLGCGHKGMIAALLLQQLHFKLRTLGSQKLDDIQKQGAEFRLVAMSIAEWQREFPIFSEQTIRRCFEDLKAAGWVISNGGIATYSSTKHTIKKRTTFWTIDLPQYSFDASDPLRTLIGLHKLGIAISMRLAQKVGLVEAILLQQTHHHSRKGPTHDGHRWLVKTFTQWHTDFLPCVCIRTIKSAISDLEAANLLISRDHVCSDERVKAYRVNYDELKKVFHGTG